MFERSTLPSTVSTEIPGSLQHTLGRRWVIALQEMLWLPENFRQYLLLLAVTLLVGAGMMTQVWLKVQVAEERYLLAKLTAQQQRIERENSELVFAIASATSLRQIEQAAIAQGYRPVTRRVYVRRDELPVLDSPVASSPAAPIASHVAELSPALEEPRPEQNAAESIRPAAQRSPLEELMAAVGRGVVAFADWVSAQAQGIPAAVHRVLPSEGSSAQ